MLTVPLDFDNAFKILTGNKQGAFPWQRALYERFVSDRANNIPAVCNLPTGLGKTSVIAIWLIALANRPTVIPRRLVYVVNRRTVVDQTTAEVMKLRDNLPKLEARPDQLCELAISTLRGQYADNREWSADPSHAAVICGTVDMIGSRLLFSGYGLGFKTRPLHAGFLGQDALLVHDEAHLEPAFQKLLIGIQDEQRRCKEFGSLRVMELSATSRSDEEPFGLQEADFANPIVMERIGAKKAVQTIRIDDSKKLADGIVDLALSKFRESARAVLVFVRKVEDVEKIVARLKKEKQSVQQLTGTLRGLERDALFDDRIFIRFLPASNRPQQITPAEGTVYLVCTSAGEVGVNISAAHLICDLSTFDSIAQRLGRVNRFGEWDDTEVHIFCPTQFDENDAIDLRLKRTLELIGKLGGDASPASLDKLDARARIDAFAPPPATLPVSPILFDTWAMTTLRDKLPGRPPVEPYLHGIADWEPPQTQVAWRDEVKVITGDLLEEHKPEELLEDFPLKPHELLRDRSDRVFKHLTTLAARHPGEPAWLIGEAGTVEPPVTLAQLADKNRKGRIDNRIILLPPIVGGLRDGLLDGSSEFADDIADQELLDDTGRPRRARVWSDDLTRDQKVGGMRLVRRISFSPPEDEEDGAPRSWLWFESPRGGDGDGSKSANKAVLWQDHTDDVVRNLERMIQHLPLSDQLKRAVILAARFHDLGKKRELWQRSIGNPEPTNWLAKSGGEKVTREITLYRHEFGSLLDVEYEAEFNSLDEEMRDLVLHLIAVHHGYGRPHFEPDRAFDPTPKYSARMRTLAVEIPLRFARLQRRYGRWGLAYLESLLRSADYEASAYPTRTVEAQS